MSNFKVGEICIGQNMIYTTQYNGMECTVTGELTVRAYKCRDTGVRMHGVGYRVRWADGKVTFTKHHNLRRKPPQQDLTAWATAKVQDITKPVNVPDQVPA